MNKTTEPIRDKKLINDMFAYLKGRSYRNYMIAKVQLNTAFRISDVLRLKVSDFVYTNYHFRESLSVVEKKTNKVRRIAINTSLEAALKEYIDLYDLTYDSYLYQSRNGSNTPITNTQAHRIFKELAEVLHLDNFGTHSLRKSWGYFAYQKTKNIALIMDAYNHTSEKVTLRYIGIQQKNKDDLYKEIKF